MRGSLLARWVVVVCVLSIMTGCGSAIPVSTALGPTPSMASVAPSPTVSGSFATGSPAASASPVVTPFASASPTPKPTPTPAIGAVRVDSSADLYERPWIAPPWYDLYFQRATVEAIGPRDAKGGAWFALGLPGSVVRRFECSLPTVNDEHFIGRLCHWSGATIWVDVASSVPVYSVNGMGPATLVGHGPAVLASYAPVGGDIASTSFEFEAYTLNGKRYGGDAAQLAMNRTSWARLQADVGRSFPRSERVFTFFAFGWLVYRLGDAGF